jgi:hypothetical protein
MIYYKSCGNVRSGGSKNISHIIKMNYYDISKLHKLMKSARRAFSKHNQARVNNHYLSFERLSRKARPALFVKFIE